MNAGIGSILFGTTTSIFLTFAPPSSAFSSFTLMNCTSSSSSSLLESPRIDFFYYSVIFGVMLFDVRRVRPFPPAGVLRLTAVGGLPDLSLVVLATFVVVMTSSLVVHFAMVGQSFGSPVSRSYALQVPMTIIDAVPPAPGVGAQISPSVVMEIVYIFLMIMVDELHSTCSKCQQMANFGQAQTTVTLPHGIEITCLKRVEHSVIVALIQCAEMPIHVLESVTGERMMDILVENGKRPI